MHHHGGGHGGFRPRGGYTGFNVRQSRPPMPDSGLPPGMQNSDDFDGKRPRKSVMRKTVDYNSSFMGMVERRIWQRDFRENLVKSGPEFCENSAKRLPERYR